MNFKVELPQFKSNTYNVLNFGAKSDLYTKTHSPSATTTVVIISINIFNISFLILIFVFIYYLQNSSIDFQVSSGQ